MTVIISAIKIIFLLGFLITIHELGHFLVAKMCAVKVNEFSIGFGPTIFKKVGQETTYTLRAIPLGGFCNMEGEEKRKDVEGSFSQASVGKRMAIVVAGATVNIIFGILIYFLLIFFTNTYINNQSYVTINIDDSLLARLKYSGIATKELIASIFGSLKLMFSGKVAVNQMVGPVGISEMVVKTSGISEFIYMMSIISISLGVTNLLPIPALDGGKLLLLLVEAIIRKPINEKFEVNLQLAGFIILMGLSLYITYNDILRII